MKVTKTSRLAGMVVLAAICALPLMMTKGARAEDNLNFTLVNQTGFALTELYIYPTEDEEIGDNWMEGTVVPNGGKYDVEFSPGGRRPKQWSVMISDKDENRFVFQGLRLVEISEIKLFYKDGICKAYANNGQREEDNN